MALSAVDSSKTQPQASVCPHCGRSVDTAALAVIGDRVKCAGGTGPGINAGASGLHRLEIVL